MHSSVGHFGVTVYMIVYVIVYNNNNNMIVFYTPLGMLMIFMVTFKISRARSQEFRSDTCVCSKA